MSKPDYYNILGVSKDATPDQIRKAFRTLAAKYHPDKNKDDPAAEAKFKQVNEANSVLSDPAKRAEYDNPPGGFTGFGGGDPFAGMGDIFSTIFGGSRPQRKPAGPKRGGDARVMHQISMAQSITGCKTTVEYRVPSGCSTCKGNGCRPGTSPQQCKGCNGLGQVMFRQGAFQITQPCGQCGGRGNQITDPCGTCRGSGVEELKKAINVNVPPGVDDGSQLRMSGAGLPSPDGGEPGDLYVVLTVGGETGWQRRGRDLINIASIPLSMAALGGTTTIKHLNGKEIEVNVPRGSQPGDTVVVHGAGIKPHGENRTGDLQVILNVAIPKKMSVEGERLIKLLQAELDREKS